jgi:hypothetical protein
LTPSASAYFDVRSNPFHRESITDASELAVLNDVVNRGLSLDPTSVTQQELYELYHSGEIDRIPATGFPTSGTQQYRCRRRVVLALTSCRRVLGKRAWNKKSSCS